MCFLRDKPGENKHIIYSKEGALQGDVFGATIYGVGMLPLADGMQIAIQQTLQPWFADDSSSGGKATHNAACLNYLLEHGPRYGYYPSPSKSWYIYKEEDKLVAIDTFKQFNLPITMTCGHTYLGGFTGSAATKDESLNDKISTWIPLVETLSKIATRWPYTVYVHFPFYLQNEWQYV